MALLYCFFMRSTPLASVLYSTIHWFFLVLGVEPDRLRKKSEELESVAEESI